MPLKWDIPLVVLAVTAGLAIVLSRKDPPLLNSPIVISVFFYLAGTGVSILVSADFGRSARSSAALLPGILLFFLIADHFHTLRHTRLLYVTVSTVAFGISVAILWTASKNDWILPIGWETWVPSVGSPILLVPNDVAFLAVTAPLSFALFYRERFSATGLLSAFSMVLSLAAVCVLHSRVALLAMAVSLIFAGALFRPRLAFASSLAVLIAAVGIDAFLGFPLTMKFGHSWSAAGGMQDGRLPIWAAAWKMFTDTPLLGNGPHTFTYTSVDLISVNWVHNLYLEMLAEQGIVGLAAIALLLISGLIVAWKVQRKAAFEERILCIGALAGLLSFSVAALFELSFLRQWVVVTLFVLLGVIAQISVNQKSAGKTIHTDWSKQ